MSELLSNLKSRFIVLSAHLDLREGGRWFFLATVLGIFIGFSAAIFQKGLDFAQDVLFTRPGTALDSAFTGARARSTGHILFILLIPAVGATVSGWLTSRFAPEAAGHGTDAVIRAYHRFSGRMRFRIAPLKLLASMFTLGTGGSAGREGPVAQFGGSLGSTLASLLKLDKRRRRILLLAGASAGIGAIFRAPLGGALFAAEVVYRGPDFEGSAVFPGVIASIVSYSTFSMIWGPVPLFHVPHFATAKPIELPFYVLMGVLCAAIGIIYVRVFYGGERVFQRLKVSAPLRAASGGLGLGALTLAFGWFARNDRVLLGGGYGLAQGAIDSVHGPLLLIALAFGKILATTCTISSGGSGGVFAPSLAIGGCIGGAFGQTAHLLLPGAAPDPAACAMVGMGAFFAGAAKTPLTAVILISEITGSYVLLVPLILVSTIAALLTPRTSIYREQVASRIYSPAHIGELTATALSRLHVADAIDASKPLPIVKQAELLERIAERAVDEGVSSFVVVDGQGRALGLINLVDLHLASREPLLGHLIAGDLVRRVARVTPDLDLRQALGLLVANEEDDLLVVDPADRARPIAILSRQDVLETYQQMTSTTPETGGA